MQQWNPSVDQRINKLNNYYFGVLIWNEIFALQSSPYSQKKQKRQLQSLETTNSYTVAITCRAFHSLMEWKWTWAAPDVSLSSVAKSDSHLAKHQFNAAVPWKQECIRPLKVASYSIGRTTTTKNPLHTQQMRHQRVKKVDRKQRNNPKVLLWVARSFSPSLGRLCLFVARCPRGPWCTLASPTTSYTQTHKQKHK